ncbi:MAG: hypothetical protein WBD25_05500 [Terriglobales bacterium]
MNNFGQYEQPAEPPPGLVECAIAKVLEIAQGQGITVADFVHMLDSGMKISDFLKAMDNVADAKNLGSSTED